MPSKRSLGGRPPGPKSKLRQRRVVVLLTNAEYRRLRASAVGVTVGARARELMLAALERGSR